MNPTRMSGSEIVDRAVQTVVTSAHARGETIEAAMVRGVAVRYATGKITLADLQKGFGPEAGEAFSKLIRVAVTRGWNRK